MKRLVGLAAAMMILVASVAFGGVVVEDMPAGKMEIVGDRLFRQTESGRVAVPDGKYFLPDGSFLLVVKGKISPAESSALERHQNIRTEVQRGVLENQAGPKPLKGTGKRLLNEVR